MECKVKVGLNTLYFDGFKTYIFYADTKILTQLRGSKIGQTLVKI